LLDLDPSEGKLCTYIRRIFWKHICKNVRFCIFSHEKENYYFEQILKKTEIRVREKKITERISLKNFPKNVTINSQKWLASVSGSGSPIRKNAGFGNALNQSGFVYYYERKKIPFLLVQEKAGVEGELCADCWRLGCLLQDRALTHTGIKGRCLGSSSRVPGEARCGGWAVCWLLEAGLPASGQGSHSHGDQR
jgi:hypothetical protein